MVVDAPVGSNLFWSPWNLEVRISVIVSPAWGSVTVSVPQIWLVLAHVAEMEVTVVWSPGLAFVVTSSTVAAET